MLTQSQVNELFEYRDGGLYWRTKPKRGGFRAGYVNSAGYRGITVSWKLYLEHRLVFLLHHGYLPEFIDHINGDKADNRIENLRPCTVSQNHYNRRYHGTSGVKGVHWAKERNKWVATLTIDGKQRTLGRFCDIESAKAAVDSARAKHHGEFARY